jgi:hypothetical protein
MSIKLNRRRFMAAGAAAVMASAFPFDNTPMNAAYIRKILDRAYANFLDATFDTPPNVYFNEIVRAHKVLKDIVALAEELSENDPAAASLAMDARDFKRLWLIKENQFESTGSPFAPKFVQQKIGGEFERNMAILESYVSRPAARTAIEHHHQKMEQAIYG